MAGRRRHYEVEPVNDSEQVYVQVDGCHLLTREQKCETDQVGQSVLKTAQYYYKALIDSGLGQSEYIGHLGDHKEFEHKMSRLVDQYDL